MTAVHGSIDRRVLQREPLRMRSHRQLFDGPQGHDHLQPGMRLGSNGRMEIRHNEELQEV